LDNSKFSDIDASVQALVRKAYDLGRDEAFRKVADVVNCGRSSSDETLALMAPDDGTAASNSTNDRPLETVGGDESHVPWWQRRNG
jgi:hypothetical protein